MQRYFLFIENQNIFFQILGFYQYFFKRAGAKVGVFHIKMVYPDGKKRIYVGKFAPGGENIVRVWFPLLPTTHSKQVIYCVNFFYEWHCS